MWRVWIFFFSMIRILYFVCVKPDIFSRLPSHCCWVCLFSLRCYLKHKSVSASWCLVFTPGRPLEYSERSLFGRPVGSFVCLCCWVVIGYHKSITPIAPSRFPISNSVWAGGMGANQYNFNDIKDFIVNWDQVNLRLKDEMILTCSNLKHSVRLLWLFWCNTLTLHGLWYCRITHYFPNLTHTGTKLG